MLNLPSCSSLMVVLLIHVVYVDLSNGDVIWEGNWARSCDFHGNDLTSVQTSGELCGRTCAQTQGCTHFTWTKYNGGTCWMKQGSVSKDSAFSTNDPDMVCGVMEDVGKNWDVACDFAGNDLSNVQIRGEDCGERCAKTPECTHFTWTSYNGGTCWMKSGPMSWNQVTRTNDQSMVCGIVKTTEGPKSESLHKGAKLYNVLATHHGAREVGACALPTSDYAVVYPVALGNIEALQHLKFAPDLCGQVLEVDCGHGSLEIIVTNSNLGGGLDLYGSTWNKLTNGKPPGQTSCSAQLISRNAFNFDGPRCYYKPGTDLGNLYYHNVGLLNTNGRIVRQATINNRAGGHRGDNPYYAFDFGPIDENTNVVFTFDDGTNYSVALRDCKHQKDEGQLWS